MKQSLPFTPSILASMTLALAASGYTANISAAEEAKKVERIEANMFGFFIALVVQALIEREVRNKMKEQKIEKIRVYPEQREASHPTTGKILDRFDNICTYKIMENSKVVETFRDSLNEDQKLILNLLNIGEDKYWKSASQSN